MANNFNHYSDKKERRLILKSFACVGFSTTSLMGLVAGLNHEYVLFLSLVISSSLFLSAWFLHKKEILSAGIISYTLYALMLYLVLTGGADGTGPVWIFIVPPVTFFIRGLKLGLVDCSIFLICVVLAFISANFFNIYEYQAPELIIRIILCFVVVALLSGFYEYFREKYSRKLIQLAKDNGILASTDSLTGLPNRRYAVEHLTEQNEQRLIKHTALSIVLFDIDNFKNINDSYGHDVGDLALKHLSALFTQSCRCNDTFTRWGGEEFLLILEKTDQEGAIKLAEKLRLTLQSSPLIIDEQSIYFTISAGVKELSTTDTLDSAIKIADKHLYRAKENGKDQVCY